jgi:hypothetical protein
MARPTIPERIIWSVNDKLRADLLNPPQLTAHDQEDAPLSTLVPAFSWLERRFAL